MLITKHLDVALRALLELAKEPNKMWSATVLSQNLGLPDLLIRRVLRDLAKAGILSSSIGRDGGYKLAKPLEKTTLGHVLQALGPKEFELGLFGQGRVRPISLDPASPTTPFWQTLEKKFWGLVKDQTLAELL